VTAAGTGAFLTPPRTRGESLRGFVLALGRCRVANEPIDVSVGLVLAEERFVQQSETPRLPTRGVFGLEPVDYPIGYKRRIEAASKLLAWLD